VCVNPAFRSDSVMAGLWPLRPNKDATSYVYMKILRSNEEANS